MTPTAESASGFLLFLPVSCVNFKEARYNIVFLQASRVGMAYLEDLVKIPQVVKVTSAHLVTGAWTDVLESKAGQVH